MARDIESFTIPTASSHFIGILRFTDNSNLGAIKLDTIKYIYKTLLAWAKNKRVIFIVIESATDNFSSGGDLKELYEQISIDDESLKSRSIHGIESDVKLDFGAASSNSNDMDKFNIRDNNVALKFLKAHYDFNSWISKYEKPIICFSSGYCFGGAASLFLSCDIRISATNIQFAFPEALIGNIPDCGAIYYLSRSKPIGKFIALTSMRLNAANLLKSNFCDFVIPFSEKTSLITHLKKGQYSHHRQSNLISLYRQIDTFLYNKQINLPKDYSLKELQIINQLDQQNDMENFKALLDSHKNSSDVFNSASKNILKSSPTALFATQNLINKAELFSQEEANLYERKAVEWQLSNGDLKEGIRAKIIDKDNNPKWRKFDPFSGDITTIASIFT